jgi:lipopolysaccharide transport system ATP-binding protein
MSETVIRVENLSKKYLLDHQQEGRSSYKSIRESWSNGISSLGKNILNPRREKGFKPSQEEFWALKDVSFEIKQGDRVGIIGRNGAGKSTLLKILSRITEPTSGRIGINGRVASLLEVGTGFHPELTGRENIFLNGAVLGMSRVEIQRKFDEIVDFAEVEKFLDTPVKRYSSGMYVRLAFAVAAHLEPEILIVDEVLAVGDSQFQEKCLGKMQKVSSEGRTVLFVSHSMESVARLTNRCIVLKAGSVHYEGKTEEAVAAYIKLGRPSEDKPAHYEALSSRKSNHLAWAKITTSDTQGIHRWGEPIKFSFALQINVPNEGICFSFQVVNHLEQPIFYHWFFEKNAPFCKQPGLHIVSCCVPRLRLFMGNYTITTWLTERRENALLETLTHICPFEVTMQGMERDSYEWQLGDCTYIDDAVWKVDSNEEAILVGNH